MTKQAYEKTIFKRDLTSDYAVIVKVPIKEISDRQIRLTIEWKLYSTAM
jgi:hypothetical protein